MIKRFSIISITLIIVLFQLAQAEFTFKELLYISWGAEDYEVGLTKEEHFSNGPNAFTVEHNDIYILDGEKNRIIKYFGTRLKQDFSFSQIKPNNFFFLDNMTYLLLSTHDVWEVKNDFSEKIFSTKSSIKKLSAAFRDEPKQDIHYIVNDHYLLIPDKINKISYTEYFGVPYSRDTRIFVSRKSNNAFSCEFSNGLGFSFVIPQLVSVKYLERTPAGNIYILVESESSIYSVNANRKVLLLTPAGELLASFKLPRVAHSAIFKEFHVDNNGNLYHMLSTEEGIYIVGWFISDEQESLAEEYNYPEKFQQDYHYLDAIFEIPEIDSTLSDSLMIPDSLDIQENTIPDIFDMNIE